MNFDLNNSSLVKPEHTGRLEYSTNRFNVYIHFNQEWVEEVQDVTIIEERFKLILGGHGQRWVFPIGAFKFYIAEPVAA